MKKHATNVVKTPLKNGGITMKYTRDEALNEIFKRGKEVKYRHDRRVTRLLEASSLVLVFSLIGVLGVFTGETKGSESFYGALMLSENTGGYLLVAAIAFILGITVALAIVHHKNTSKGGANDEKND